MFCFAPRLLPIIACVRPRAARCTPTPPGSVSWTSTSHPPERVSPSGLTTLIYILDGLLKTAKKKAMIRALHSIDVPHSPSDPISVHRKLLRKHISKLRRERRPSQDHARNVMRRIASEVDASGEALAEVSRNWPQRVSHVQNLKAAIVHNFRSRTHLHVQFVIHCVLCFL